MDYRVFGLDDSGEVVQRLAGVDVVLNAAGPFAFTAERLAGAAIRARCHYVDINGEIDVTLPAKSAVNLEMRNMQGSMYSDFDFPAEDKQMRKIGGGAVNARLNGGGVNLKMTNINGNIYLRKK